MESISVLIVDDQTLMREGLRSILSLEDGIDVIGVAEDGRAALKIALEQKPDVVLMDIRMPYMDGVTCTREILKRLPGTRVVILSTFADDLSVNDALRAGASGYLLKDIPAENLITAIREIHAGVIVLQPEVMESLLHSTPYPKEPSLHPLQKRLTSREWEVLQLMGQGLGNKEIATGLFVTEGTIKNYISAIYEKLEVKDRTQAVLLLKEL